MFKLELKDYITLGAALFTIATVLWRGGEIAQQVEQTQEVVKTIIPQVGRLDHMTDRLEVMTDNNTRRIEEHSRRIDSIENRLNGGLGVRHR